MASDTVFPLVDRLPSTASAGELNSPLFGGFPGTMQSSDFPRAYVLGVRLWAFPSRPARLAPVGTCGISRFGGVLTP